MDKVTQRPQGTWKLLIRNGKGGSNSVNPFSFNYVNAGIVEANRGSDGKFLFRMYSGYETNTWKQSNNPFKYSHTWGYQPIDVRGQFAGLHRGNLGHFAPFALYIGQAWRDAVSPTKGKIRDASGNGYDAVMRSSANEDLYLVNVGSSKSVTRTVATKPKGALSCPLTVDNKNWLPAGYGTNSPDRFAVTINPSTNVVSVKRMDANKGWGVYLKFYCTVALDTSQGLGSDQNSVVGQGLQIYAGLNQFLGGHGNNYFYKTHLNATDVPVGQVGAWLQTVYKHDRTTWMGPAHKCSDAGCPFVPVHEIKVYEQTFYWSDPLGWQQKKWHHGVPTEGENIVIPKEWTVILDGATARLATLTVQGTLILANGGQHEFCRPNPKVKRDNQDACPGFSVKDECLMELRDEETKRITKPKDTCVWVIEPFPPLFLMAEIINIEGGRMTAGNKTHPYTHYLHIHMLGKRGENGARGAPNKQMINVHGHLTLLGEPRKIWTRLAAHGMIGDSKITVEGNMGWRKGDKIVVTPGTTASSACHSNQPEFFDVVAVSVEKGNTVVTLNGKLRQNHIGEVTKASSYGEPGRPGKGITVDTRAAVGMLNR